MYLYFTQNLGLFIAQSWGEDLIILSILTSASCGLHSVISIAFTETASTDNSRVSAVDTSPVSTSDPSTADASPVSTFDASPVSVASNVAGASPNSLLA